MSTKRLDKDGKDFNNPPKLLIPTNASGNLRRALKKSKWCCNSKWGGYLTPSEAIALVDELKVKPSNAGWVAYLRFSKKNGKSSPSWFYFSV